MGESQQAMEKRSMDCLLWAVIQILSYEGRILVEDRVLGRE
jgi:hypothetical protein